MFGFGNKKQVTPSPLWPALSTLYNICEKHGWPRIVYVSPSTYNEIWYRITPDARTKISKQNDIPLGFSRIRVKYPMNRPKSLNLSNDTTIARFL